MTDLSITSSAKPFDVHKSEPSFAVTPGGPSSTATTSLPTAESIAAACRSATPISVTWHRPSAQDQGANRGALPSDSKIHSDSKFETIPTNRRVTHDLVQRAASGRVTVGLQREGQLLRQVVSLQTELEQVESTNSGIDAILSKRNQLRGSIANLKEEITRAGVDNPEIVKKLQEELSKENQRLTAFPTARAAVLQFNPDTENFSVATTEVDLGKYNPKMERTSSQETLLQAVGILREGYRKGLLSAVDCQKSLDRIIAQNEVWDMPHDPQLPHLGQQVENLQMLLKRDRGNGSTPFHENRT